MSTKKIQKKSSSKLTSIFTLVLLILATLAGLYLIKQNQNPNENAGALGCSSYTDVQSCTNNCSPLKRNGERFQCKFIKGRCIESSGPCTNNEGSGIGQCPSGLDCWNIDSEQTNRIHSKNWSNLFTCKDASILKFCCISGFSIQYTPTDGYYCTKK